ncbi:Uncharacterised protein [uncultured archaeon]|nr:Uncharacterised protein [uncultured archaeon]
MATFIDVMDKLIGLPQNDVQVTIEYIGSMLLSVLAVYIVFWIIVRIGERIS